MICLDVVFDSYTFWLIKLGKFFEIVNVFRINLYGNGIGVGRDNLTIKTSSDNPTHGLGNRIFHASTNDGSIRLDKRNGLTLHVRTHERTSTVVVLKEGNERGWGTNNLSGDDVDVFDFLSVDLDEFSVITSWYPVVG